MYPATRGVSSEQLHCTLEMTDVINRSAHALRIRFPKATIVFRTNNAKCDARNEDLHADVFRAYACAGGSCDSSQMQTLRKRCEIAIGLTPAECAATVQSAKTSAAQRQLALHAMKEHPDVRLFDAHQITRDRCRDTADGRHYPKLLDELSLKLLQTVLGSTHMQRLT